MRGEGSPFGGPSVGLAGVLLGDARPAGALGSSAGSSGRGTKRRADRVDTSTMAPRFVVRCAVYIQAVIHRRLLRGLPGLGKQLCRPPRRLLLQQTRDIARPHFWWPWDASIGPPSCAQRGHPCLLPSAVAAHGRTRSTGRPVETAPCTGPRRLNHPRL